MILIDFDVVVVFFFDVITVITALVVVGKYNKGHSRLPCCSASTARKLIPEDNMINKHKLLQRLQFCKLEELFHVRV